jgi:hypothetical protein
MARTKTIAKKSAFMPTKEPRKRPLESSKLLAILPKPKVMIAGK